MSMLSLLSSPSVIDVARAQFGFVIAFYIIFPSFSIGLASYLACSKELGFGQRSRFTKAKFNYCCRVGDRSCVFFNQSD